MGSINQSTVLTYVDVHMTQKVFAVESDFLILLKCSNYNLHALLCLFPFTNSIKLERTVSFSSKSSILAESNFPCDVVFHN